VVGRVSSPRFIGRREELAALDAAVAQAHAGRGTVVLVAAEAGVGKSRLISEFADRTDATVAIGECLPLGEGELPYAPIVGALRSLARQRPALLGAAHEDVAALLPELSIAGDAVPVGERSQGRLFEQLLALLTGAARKAPLALVVEDFQWGDRSTRDFLAFLVRAARREPIVLVVTYRNDELDRRHPLQPSVVELERSGRAVRLELAPFTRSELRAQVAAIRGERPPARLVDRLLERSEGNAFYTEELLAWSTTSPDTLPASLRDTLLGRVEAQPAPVQEVLRIVAAAGRSVEHSRLAEVTQLPDDELNDALRTAVDSHLLAPDYSFRHALLREAIYSELLAGERRSLHRALAQAGAGAPAELAHHWHAAGELAAALAASLEAAAAAEALHAPGEALLHYERALEIWDRVDDPPAEPSRLEVTRRAAEAALRAAEPARAIELGRAAIDRIDARADPVAAALAHERLGRYVWVAGRDEDAVPIYCDAVELMPAGPSEERALVLAAYGQVLMLCDRVAESPARRHEALAIARAVGAAAVEAHVLNTMSATLTSIGDADGGLAAATEALAIGRRLHLVDESFRSYTNGSDTLDQLGRVDESIAMAREGIGEAGALGVDRSWGDFLRAELAGRLLATARWAEAEAVLEEIVDSRPTGMNAGIGYLHLGQLLGERGDFDGGRAALDTADEHIRRATGSMWLGPAAAVRASLELWAGRPDEALAVVTKCLDRVSDGGYVFSIARVYERGARAHSALVSAADAHSAATDLLARLDARIARLRPTVPPLVAASRATCAAECSAIGGGGDPALWADAAARWEALGDRYDAACARWRGAEALLAAGADRSEAEPLVRAAHAVATELAARPLRERVERLARRARIDLGGGRPADGHLDRFDLSDRELEVLALLGEGLTNREIAAELFISAKTASAHVSHILGKLSVPNRAAAAAAAQALGVRRAS